MKTRFFSGLGPVVCLVATLLLSGCSGRQPSYSFDRMISEEVLNNYLDRSVTMAGLLSEDPFGMDKRYLHKEADLEFIRRSGVKFIGRAIGCWGHEDYFNERQWLEDAAMLAGKIHAIDPDIILQAAVFEAVYKEGFNRIHIPEWTFVALGLEPEDRNFDFDRLQFPDDGRFLDLWGPGSCAPDIRQTETQLWYMYLIGTYVRLGVESFHLGQTMVTGFKDEGWRVYDAFLSKARAYATPLSRRHYILFDSHAGPKGMVTEDGRSLIDFNAYPLRIKEVKDNPEHGILEVGWLDAIYCKSPGGITPSGWHCRSLPYLVEFDNFGITDHPGEAHGDHCPWGYDDISWFYKQPLEYKKEFLRYAWDWLKKTDPAGHLQMPAARGVTLPPPYPPSFVCRAMAPSGDIPYGMDIEGTILELWNIKRPK